MATITAALKASQIMSLATPRGAVLGESLGKLAWEWRVGRRDLSHASILNSSVYRALFAFDIRVLLAQSLVAQQGMRFSGARSVLAIREAAQTVCAARSALPLLTRAPFAPRIRIADLRIGTTDV